MAGCSVCGDTESALDLDDLCERCAVNLAHELDEVMKERFFEEHDNFQLTGDQQ